MRELLKKSGISIVIVVSVIAIAFFPKNVAQWMVMAAVAVFAFAKISSYYSAHKDEISNKKEKIKSKFAGDKKSESDKLLKFLIMQLSYRVTDKLHSAFPDSSWHWVQKPTANLFSEGGIVRIATNHTDEFTEADVILDVYGRIELKMLKGETVTKLVKETDANADTDYTIDADVWYSQCAQRVLTDTITNLNACGTKSLCIREDGSMVIHDDEVVGTLKAFPGKNLWKKIVSIFESNGLTAVENENCIELGW